MRYVVLTLFVMTLLLFKCTVCAPSYLGRSNPFVRIEEPGDDDDIEYERHILRIV